MLFCDGEDRKNLSFDKFECMKYFPRSTSVDQSFDPSNCLYRNVENVGVAERRNK